MTTDTGMWRPNWTFWTLEQSFNRLRLKAKWYAFQCRRCGDARGAAFWASNAAEHAAAIAAKNS